MSLAHNLPRLQKSNEGHATPESLHKRGIDGKLGGEIFWWVSCEIAKDSVGESLGDWKGDPASKMPSHWKGAALGNFAGHSLGDSVGELMDDSARELLGNLVRC